MGQHTGRYSYLRDPWLLGLLALAAACVPWFLAGPGPVASSWVVQTGLDLVMLWFGRRLARLSSGQRFSLRFWRAVQVTMVLCASGDGLQAVLVLLDPGRTDVSVIQTGLVATGMSVMVVTMLRHPLGAAGRERLRLSLDAVTVLVGVAVFLWYFSLAPQLSDGGVGDRWLAAASTAVMLVVVFGVLKLVYSDPAPFNLSAGVVGSVGVALTALGTSLGLVFSSASDHRVAVLLQVLPCILVPASLRMQEVRIRARGVGRTVERRARYARTPYLAVLAAEVLLLAALPKADADLRTWGVAVGVIVITAVVLARQLVAFTDNDRLLHSLDRSLAELHEQKEWFRSLVQHASDVTLVVAAGDFIRYASPAADRVLGAGLEGSGLDHRIHPDDYADFRALRSALAAAPGADASAQVRVRHDNGTYRWLDFVGADLTANRSVRGVVWNARDVTEARLLQDQLRHEATHDQLTGLANRTLLADRLQLAGAAEVAVLVLDLDGFKQVNDRHGHHTGDELLVRVAGLLRVPLGPDDLAVRLGGDEFAVLLRDGGAERAAALAAGFAQVMTMPVEISGVLLAVGASIGVATGPASDPDALLRDADAAMYRVKHERAGL
ncbi:diguanylate cyclase domain-containing protein [Symbioplanes lichenis]|uniref:diguanylate cyclase domain-containing protein n=1 Tax=Symbioplanes lichenis TaxID=1629072 RepID=UPI0027391138|nr:diguanylate cyclase [Actinoplanes lichenis]